MPSQMITLVGKLAELKPEDARRIAVYLVRGNEVLAHANVQDNGSVRITLSRHVLATSSAYGLEAVIGPAGMAQRLEQVPNLHRVPLDQGQLEKAEAEFHIHLEKIRLSEEILRIWWIWCRWYCVNGRVVGPDGCPIPYADVTVYNVAYTSAGFSRTALTTVTTDANGQFTACFIWCSCFFCCWPCWPFWWLCWPWWWERDILRVIEDIERRINTIPPNPAAMSVTTAPLQFSQPASKDLVRGQGFTSAQQVDVEFVPDASRTAFIQSKLSDTRIRAQFPWWWWCCDDPNIIFSATQGQNVILNENPSTDTRWCLEDGSNVTLIANQEAITVCPGSPKPLQGFVWTRVGGITVNNIHGGYADGFAGSDTSDMPFAYGLDIYGEFAAASPVAYYQVNLGQWSGNPSRGGTPPSSSTLLSTPLYNTALIQNGSTITFASVLMGPFNTGGVTNLYATQEQRSSVPSSLLPPLPAGTVLAWGYNGRKLDTDASNLISGGNLGAVDLTITGYDTSFTSVTLPPNTDDTLTLEIDTTGLTATINSLQAFDVNGNVVNSTQQGACPAYNVGIGGYVVLNVTVQDSNGHLFEYLISPNFGSSSVGTTTPGLRGYRQTVDPFPPSPPYGVPVYAQKSFVGGTENIRFYPQENCCYDFRLGVGKRVTNGGTFPFLYTAAFQTVTLNVS